MRRAFLLTLFGLLRHERDIVGPVAMHRVWRGFPRLAALEKH
jgi:hypothetical protein